MNKRVGHPKKTPKAQDSEASKSRNRSTSNFRKKFGKYFKVNQKAKVVKSEVIPTKKSFQKK